MTHEPYWTHFGPEVWEMYGRRQVYRVPTGIGLGCTTKSFEPWHDAAERAAQLAAAMNRGGAGAERARKEMGI